MSDEESGRKPVAPDGHDHHHHHEHHQYGTFQAGPGRSEPAMGFPHPVPPPGITGSPPPPPPPTGYYQHHHGYQAVPGYAVVGGTPASHARLPCCGIGIGWFLFIIGFLLPAIPWYVGAFILLCVRIDYREKPGLILCTIAAALALIAIIIGATKGADAW